MRAINRRLFVYWGVGCAALVLAAAFALLPLRFQNDRVLALREVLACRGSEGVAQKELCYEKRIPLLMNEGLAMERVFEIVSLVQSVDTEYQSCHVLAHLITAREVQRDPSRWKDVVARSPFGMCGNGAMHGAFQERFRESSFPDVSVTAIGDTLAGVCDPREGWEALVLQQSSCMHGVGHLLLFVTDADVQKSIALCEAIGKRPKHDHRQTCFEGVFMQLYQPMEPEDVMLIHAIADDAKQTKEFCAKFKGDAHNACVKESWPAVSGSANTAQGLEALCTQLGDRESIEYCVTGLIYPVVETLHYEVSTLKAFCGGLASVDLQRICWSRLASKFVWADWSYIPQALSICEDAPIEFSDACWGGLADYARNGLKPDSSETKKLCRGMPEPWRESCAQRTNTAL